MLSPTAAHAQWWGLSAGGSLGSTTNGGTNQGAVLGVPEQDQLQSDAFVRTAVGAELFARTRRTAQQLTYNFANFLHFGSGKQLSFSNDLLWNVAVVPGRDSDLTFSLSGNQGRTGDLYLFNYQPAGGSVARPTSSTWFLGGHAHETFNWAIDPFWAFTQDLGGDLFVPIGVGEAQARTWGGTAHLGLFRRFTTDSIGLRAGVAHGRSTAVNNMSVGMIPPRKANSADALLTFVHAFNDDWTGQFGAGVVAVNVPQIRNAFLDASFAADVSYRTQTGGVFAAHAGRGVVTNVFVGDTLLQTGGGLRFTQFFGRNEAWQVVGGLDFQHGKSVFVVDEKQGGLKVFNAVAGLNYEFSRHIMFDLEANYTYQDAEASRRGIMFMPPYTLHRTMVMASIAYVFPQPEKLTGGGGGRRRPRTVGRGGAGPGDVRTGLEAVIDPASKAERPGEEAGTGGAGASATRGRRDRRADRRDAARGYDPEENPAQVEPGAMPDREQGRRQ